MRVAPLNTFADLGFRRYFYRRLAGTSGYLRYSQVQKRKTSSELQTCTYRACGRCWRRGGMGQVRWVLVGRGGHFCMQISRVVDQSISCWSIFLSSVHHLSVVTCRGSMLGARWAPLDVDAADNDGYLDQSSARARAARTTCAPDQAGRRSFYLYRTRANVIVCDDVTICCTLSFCRCYLAHQSNSMMIGRANGLFVGHAIECRAMLDAMLWWIGHVGTF